MSLTIGYAYNSGSSPNIIVATGYDVKYWYDPEAEPADTDPDRVVSVGGTSWSLPAVDPKTNDEFGSGTYHFRVRAKNVFGVGPWSSVKDWPTLAGGGGVVGPVTYSLVAPPDGIGLNSVSILHSVPFTVKDVGSVGKIGQLVDAINDVADANVVTAVGILTDNQIQGAYVTYDQQGNPTFTPTAGFADGANTALERGMSLQISVNDSVSVTFQ